MSVYAIQLRADPLRTLAYTSITSSYTNIGAPLAHPTRILYVENQTDVLCIFSFNASTDHFALPSGGFLLLDVTTNELPAEGFYISVGTQMAVRTSGSPSTGDIYVSVFYAGS